MINTSQIIANEIEQASRSPIITGDSPDINEFDADGDFEKKIADIASMHNADINFYAKNWRAACFITTLYLYAGIY